MKYIFMLIGYGILCDIIASMIHAATSIPFETASVVCFITIFPATVLLMLAKIKQIHSKA